MDDDWSLRFEQKFEHIDWCDLADAEQSGDQEAIQKLMDKSLEIKQQKALEKLPTTPLPTTPLALSTPTENLPFSEFLEEEEDEWEDVRANQSLPVTMATPKSTTLFRKPSSTYADIAAKGSKVGIRGAGKVGKRKMVERVGLSPIDIPPKRTALRELVTPPALAPQHRDTPVTTELEELGMEMCTPDVDKPPRVGVQRRLFDAAKKSPSSCSPWQLKENDTALDNNHRLAQRQKQIDFGKNTPGYEIYIQSVPKWKRSKNDPWTPDKRKDCSTRAWQGRMRVWRRALHKYDPPTDEEPPITRDEDSVSSECELITDCEVVKKDQFTVQDAALCAILDIDEGSIDMKY